MFIQIEANDVEITPESQKYIQTRVYTLLKPHIADIKTLKIHLSKVRDLYRDKIRCILVLKSSNNSNKYAEFSSSEITVSLESAVNQLRIGLFDKTEKIHSLQSRIRLLKRNRDKFNTRQYLEHNQLVTGA